MRYRIRRSFNILVCILLSILTLLLNFIVFNRNAFADTINADGSITKTAVVFVPDTEEITCSANSWTRIDTAHGGGACMVSGCGQTVSVEIQIYQCDVCGVTVQDQVYTVNCGHYSSTYNAVSPHTGKKLLSTNFCPACGHDCTNAYPHWASEYGVHVSHAKGNAPTFKVWPLTVVANDGLSYDIAVSGATATDAAMSGHTVTITPSGMSAGSTIKITNSGTGDINTVTSGSAYTFTMPAKVTTVTLELAKQPQTVTVISPVSKTYNQVSFNLGATVS